MENKKEYAKIQMIAENGKTSAEIESNSMPNLILAMVVLTEKVLESLSKTKISHGLALKAGLLSLIIDGKLTDENLEKHNKILLKEKQVS